jgi:hypothetical protein
VNDDDEWTRTNIHALNGIRNHSLRVQVIKAYASDHATTGTGKKGIHLVLYRVQQLDLMDLVMVQGEERIVQEALCLDCVDYKHIQCTRPRTIGQLTCMCMR